MSDKVWHVTEHSDTFTCSQCEKHGKEKVVTHVEIPIEKFCSEFCLNAWILSHYKMDKTT